MLFDRATPNDGVDVVATGLIPQGNDFVSRDAFETPLCRGLRGSVRVFILIDPDCESGVTSADEAAIREEFLGSILETRPCTVEG